MRQTISDRYISVKEDLNDCILHFETKGKPFGNQDRNSLKLFEIEGDIFNVKSFKVPNIFNQLAYRWFRKSKAERSYIHATKLKNLGIGTPEPIAFYEFSSALLFKKSYYVSEQLEPDYTFRDLSRNLNLSNHEYMLRAFTRFTFNLHENGILFLDHSPGNTLIKKTNSGYEFYLVDLNRMRFGQIDLETRIKNFERLSSKPELVKVMSDEYAQCIGESSSKIYSLMWQFTKEFQEKFYRKKRLKKSLKFWKK